MRRVPAEYLVTGADQAGQILRGFRKELGLTQAQVGQRMGVPQKEISHLENGSGRTSVDRLFALMSALGIEMVLRPRDSEAPSSPESW